MAYSLLWLPAVLKAAGLKVAVVPGWEERGHGDMGPVYGVLCHHTATSEPHGNMPTLHTLVQGRADPPLAGPLAQLGLGRDGTYYVVAAGRCWHAGAGVWQNITNGNANFIGIEAENTGLAADIRWPDVQLAAYQHGAAAILRHIRRDARYCAGHKEYALPAHRKPDPDFDMHAFRAGVASILAGTAPPLALVPAAEAQAAPGQAAPRPTLRRGDTSELTRLVQARLGLAADGIFGAGTEALLRAFQRQQGLVPDGLVGPTTWQALDAV